MNWKKLMDWLNNWMRIMVFYVAKWLQSAKIVVLLETQYML